MSVRANQTAYQPQEIALQERKINLNPKVLNVVLNRKSWFQRNFAVRVHRTLNNNVLLQGAEPFLSNAFGLAEALRTVTKTSQILISNKTASQHQHQVGGTNEET